MKCFLLALWLLAAVEPSFAQALPDTSASTTSDLLAKSKRQRAGARTLLIGGSIMAATAIAIGAPGNVGFGELALLGVMGGLGITGMVCSMPLYAAARRNERRAATASVVLRPLPVAESPSRNVLVPAIGIRVGL